MSATENVSRWAGYRYNSVELSQEREAGTKRNYRYIDRALLSPCYLPLTPFVPCIQSIPRDRAETLPEGSVDRQSRHANPGSLANLWVPTPLSAIGAAPAIAVRQPISSG